MTRYFDEKLEVWVNVCPPGEAFGARDIKNWAHRRQMGRTGSDGWKERERLKAWRKGELFRTKRKRV